MKDLVCVVADKQIKATLEELLRRPLSLGIRPIQAKLLLEPHHDPGCYARPADLLRGYRQAAAHGLIVLDHAWDGVPVASGAELEALIAEKLHQAGMADWAVPVVIEPELEAWVFSTSPYVPDVLGWKGPWPTFRKALEERNLWTAADAKPADPKAAIEYVLGRTGKSRSASLFRRLARKVNTAGCQDRAFLRLKTLLQTWFPPIPSTGVDGQPSPSTPSSQPDGRSRGRTYNVEHQTKTRKKLIEVALPLDDINVASVREKSIRHGHPSTLHLWWARRPLAAARAVIFAQLVDDPSAHPELFPTEKTQEQERKRLFGIVRELVKWKNTTNEVVLEQAREEIRESWRRTCADNAEHRRATELFDPDRLPAFHDPFAGGGALPLEAQRLGLEAYASDLNPVAVLINKAMIEIPPRFAGRPPVNPESRAEQTVVAKTWRGARGLAHDVRYYGRWMREEAEKRIGHLYPPVEVTPELVRERPDLKPYEGRKLTVIAWLWARTVRSPNPAFADVDVPLVSTFMLSTKKGKQAYVEPVVEGRGYRFMVRVGAPPDLEAARAGTKLSSGANFRCLMSGSPVAGDYIMAEGQRNRIGARLMAIVAQGDRRRVYLPPMEEQQETARGAVPQWRPDVEFFQQALGFRVGNYGMTKWGDLFTSRQLVVLTTLSDLVTGAADRVRRDAVAAGLADEPDDERPLRHRGSGATAYAEAVGLYLGLAIDRGSDYGSTICTWHSSKELIRNTFGRQAIPMTWDFAETNAFSNSAGNFLGGVDWVSESLEYLCPRTHGSGTLDDSQRQTESVDKVVSTDPPYYDNIGYADLSDFFYVWLRRSLRSVFPDMFETLTSPKAEELVACPHRHGSRAQAESFFLQGMTQAMGRLATQTHPGFPVTIYYAFKQSETVRETGTASTGWETFLEAVIDSGFAITGTWPIRTELGNRMRGVDSNALASSIVLVCRRHSASAAVASRRGFLAALRSELPEALVDLQTSNIAPVDLAQAAIGPGMAVFTRYEQVLEADGSAMSVRSALVEINRMLDETLATQEGDLDADTRFCVAWYEQYGMAERAYGEAEVLFNAKNTSFEGLRSAGVIAGGKGRVRIRGREELDSDWDPANDRRVTDWEGAQHLTRALTGRAGVAGSRKRPGWCLRWAGSAPKRPVRSRIGCTRSLIARSGLTKRTRTTFS